MMSLPISLHGNEYLEHLRYFRDSALSESHWFGRRRNIGGFTFGMTRAHWQTEEGGTAYLLDEGLRYKRTAISTFMPTTLHLYSPPEEAGIELVTYKMEIDDVGCIEVFHGLITEGTFLEVAKRELFRRQDRRYGLSTPTDEQRELLYTEMQRGATGLYVESSD